MMQPGADISAVQANAAEAARLLRLLANERRLLLLCYLVGAGEMTVTALAATLGLSRPALSQHLAKLRADGLEATRKSSQTVFYRLADPKVARLLEVLRDLYCPPDMPIPPAAVEHIPARSRAQRGGKLFMKSRAEMARRVKEGLVAARPSMII